MFSPSRDYAFDSDRQVNDAPRRYDINIELGDMKSSTATLPATYQPRSTPEAEDDGQLDITPSASATRKRSAGERTWKRKVTSQLPCLGFFILATILFLAIYHVSIRCFPQQAFQPHYWY